jgi:hypothetical protein
MSSSLGSRCTALDGEAHAPAFVVAGARFALLVAAAGAGLLLVGQRIACLAQREYRRFARVVALQQGVFLQGLVDFGVEFQRGKLQQPDRLLQLRRQGQMLGEPELESLLHDFLFFALHLEVLAEINPTHTFIIDYLGRLSSGKHFPGVDDGGAIADAQGFAHVVVGDQDADAASLR